MSPRDLLYETFSALNANKMRSFLTILGIVIGISAVITMTSLIGGIQNMLVSQLGLSQAKELYISGSGPRGGLTTEDLDIIEENVSGYETITGTLSSSSEVSTGQESNFATITGVTNDYFELASTPKVLYGRPLTSEDNETSSLVAVLDEGSVETLFGKGTGNVVGKSFLIGSDSYLVVGITEKSSTSLFDFGGVSVTVPLRTCEIRMVGTGTELSSITGIAADGSDIASLTMRTTAFLQSYLNVEQDIDGTSNGYVSVQSVGSIVESLNMVMTAFSVIMGAVASISLFVGGIGIMNMMLTNVTERIREIGLRKSLGAREKDITAQFLLESIVLCIMGGIFGILFGYIGARLITVIVMVIKSDLMFTPAITITSIALAVGISVLIGVIFGYGPARRAAKLNPVESLRYQ